MSVIRNLSSEPIFIPLNSGESIRLSAGKASGPVPDVELKDNEKIIKLVRQRTISVASESEGETRLPKGDANSSVVDSGKSRSRNRPHKKG